MKKVKALGIMNGTSLDGIDYALIEVSPSLKTIKFLKHWSKSIPKPLKSKLLSAANNEAQTYEVSQVHFELGKLYAQHIKQIKKQASFDIVGLHGQTLHHEGRRASLQMGHPGFLFEATKKPIYFDFRSADIIAGGEGAPFAPFFQKKIAPNTSKPFAFHNLGGISNLTYFNKSKVFGFDTGPANILMDAWYLHKAKKPFDRNGSCAERGLPSPQVVNCFLKHKFFQQKHPKSTGREDFNLNFIIKEGGAAFNRLDLEDQMASLAEVTARSIADSYKTLKPMPEAIYFYGGGILNKYLMKRISFYLPETNVQKTDDLGWPTQAFEASVFGFLAAARHFEKKVHLPQVTGAKSSQHLGAVYF